MGEQPAIMFAEAEGEEDQQVNGDAAVKKVDDTVEEIKVRCPRRHLVAHVGAWHDILQTCLTLMIVWHR